MFTLQELTDPRVQYLMKTALEDAARKDNLEARRERLERAACKARRDNDGRAYRYFAAADKITEIIEDEGLDN